MSDLKELKKLYKNTIKDNEENKGSTFPKSYVKKCILYNIAFVKVENDKIIGAYFSEKNQFGNPYVMNKVPFSVLWLHQIMVFPEYQNKGYGMELMKHYFELGKSLETKSFRLVCKESLLGYYNKFGFKVLEKNEHKRVQNDYVMEIRVKE